MTDRVTFLLHESSYIQLKIVLKPYVIISFLFLYKTNMSHHSETLYHYFERELKRALGVDRYTLLLEILDEHDNGLCGVETTTYIFPALLRALGVEPERSYRDDFGMPLSDGEQAATVEERKLIFTALEEAGFKLSYVLFPSN